MQPLPVAVKPASQETLLLVERHLPYGPPEKHTDRLQQQGRGEVTYLIAWDGTIPIGHALLKWHGSSETYIAELFSHAPCPEVEDLLVVEKHRSQGVGTQLLHTAERLVAARGFTQIGLGVDIHNVRARHLYERLGFQDVGLEPRLERYEYVDSQGKPAFWEETCMYLVKPLS